MTKTILGLVAGFALLLGATALVTPSPASATCHAGNACGERGERGYVEERVTSYRFVRGLAEGRGNGDGEIVDTFNRALIDTEGGRLIEGVVEYDPNCTAAGCGEQGVRIQTLDRDTMLVISDTIATNPNGDSRATATVRGDLFTELGDEVEWMTKR